MSSGELAWTVSQNSEVHIARHYQQKTSILTFDRIGHFLRKTEIDRLLVDAVVVTRGQKEQLVMTSTSHVEVLEIGEE